VPTELDDQRAYYGRTAAHYDAMHVNQFDEHGKALRGFLGLAEIYGPVVNVLDVGAGTGRALEIVKLRWPGTAVTGVEPVEALRRIGYAKGITEDELIAGDALNLPFEDDSFDFVIETGALHHIKTPLDAVAEMVRVARKGVLISDSNNIGQGGATARIVKLLVKSLGLWPALTYVTTRGRMYKSSAGDGIYYSFTAFDCVATLQSKFPVVHYMNTVKSNGFDLYRGASHVMLFATKN
jgi:ubiquinone/menaquinone biosynthesis C-methylase UbiE